MLGPVHSNIYFARIAENTVADYCEAFVRMDENTLLADLTTQIHRNAEIATAKHAWVRRSLVCSFLGAVPWAASVMLLVKH